MTNQNTITWILLLTLTLSAGLISGISASYVAPVILFLALLKFIGVVFNFMEMKKAHTFWKVTLLSFLFIFYSVILTISLIPK